MSNPPTPAFRQDHPLLSDPARLEKIADVMWAEIHKTLHLHAPRRVRSSGPGANRVIGAPATEKLLQGGVSPEDILAESLEALLGTADDKVTHTWEALATGISINKTKSALRAGEAGLRETLLRPRLTVVSGDQPGLGANDDQPAVFDVLADPSVDLAAEFTATNQQLELLRLTREILSERDRAIFIGRHFQERTFASLAEEHHLTPPGVRHIYRDCAKRLYAHPRFQRYSEGGLQ